MIVHGDCVAEMAKMPEASVDAVVCDPPYMLGFMGKAWDTLTPGQVQHGHDRWAREALRVLKPGGHLLAFGGTRTYHRLACAIEDAGFEIRDCLSWMYGSGFPKSLDVSKAIDKAAGAEREVLGVLPSSRGIAQPEDSAEFHMGEKLATAPATPEAQQWQGWGTSLKPAHEPVVVARKPLAGTVSANVLEYGTGALNVDGCRIDGKPRTTHADGNHTGNSSDTAPSGRWPANVCLSHHEDCEQVGTRRVKGSGWAESGSKASENRAMAGPNTARDPKPDSFTDADGLETVEAWRCVESCPVRLLDEQGGNLPTQANRTDPGTSSGGGVLDWKGSPRTSAFNGESGGASRFFYTAKASSAERNAGLEGFEEGSRPLAISQWEGQTNGSGKEMGPSKPQRNVHPTVKPIALMRWLVRLVTPPGGTVLDPFTGSGTTGIAAALEGFNFVGIEREEEYVRIAEARIDWWSKHPEGVELSKGLEADRKRRAVADTGQLGFLD
jgi:DNA modification methylase